MIFRIQKEDPRLHQKMMGPSSQSPPLPKGTHPLPPNLQIGFFRIPPPFIRDRVAMSLRRSEATEAISDVLEKIEIAALPSVTRNDESRLRHSLKGGKGGFTSMSIPLFQKGDKGGFSYFCLLFFSEFLKPDSLLCHLLFSSRRPTPEAGSPLCVTAAKLPGRPFA